MRRPRVIRVALASLLAVTLSAAACAPSEDEVREAFDGIGGVQRVWVDCSKSCTTQVDLAADITEEQTARALTAARSLDSRLNLFTIAEGKGHEERLASPRTVHLDVDSSSDDAHDAELAAAMVQLYAGEDLPRTRLFATPYGIRAEAHADSDQDFWKVTPAVWGVVGDVPGLTLQAETGKTETSPSTVQVEVQGTWPSEAFAVAHDLATTRGHRDLTGILVRSDHLGVGAPSVTRAHQVRTYIESLPEGDSLPGLDVHATDDLYRLHLAAQGEEPPNLLGLLTDLEARDDVRSALQTSGAITVATSDPSSAGEVFLAVRDDLLPSETDLDLQLSPRVTEDRGTHLLLAPTADPALIDLVEAIGGSPRRLSVTSQPTEYASGTQVGLTVTGGDLAGEVERMAGVLGSWVSLGHFVDEVSFAITVENAGTARFTVDVASDPPLLTEAEHSALSEEELRAAWERGLS
jgi:hypothetical protein